MKGCIILKMSNTFNINQNPTNGIWYGRGKNTDAKFNFSGKRTIVCREEIFILKKKIMKVAVCLSGQPRYALECFPFIYQHIIEPNNADVFIHMNYAPGS